VTLTHHDLLHQRYQLDGSEDWMVSEMFENELTIISINFGVTLLVRRSSLLSLRTQLLGQWRRRLPNHKLSTSSHCRAQTEIKRYLQMNTTSGW
jgi:hypothetical protein